MPKPIKKKLSKPQTQQEDIQDIMSKLRDKAFARKKQLTIVAATVVVIMLIAMGTYLINRNATERAANIEAQGYKMFMGLYDATSMPKAERMEKALASFKDANATRPTAFRHYYIAVTLYELGRYDECIKELDSLASEYPNNVRFIPIVNLKKAHTYQTMGDNEKALETLREFISFNTGKIMKDIALVETAEILERMGKENEAQQYYDLLLKEHPESRLASIAQSRLKLPEMLEPVPIDPNAPTQIQAPATETGQKKANKPLSIELK